jgi:uncharacterized protein (TIGR03083 family)
MGMRAADVRGLRTIRRGDDADALTMAAFEQVIALLEDLTPQEWEVVTSYRGWTVHETVAHLVGAASSHASVLESKRQAGQVLRSRAETGIDEVEARTALQIAENVGLSPSQLIFRLRTLAPRAVAGRLRRESWFGTGPSPRVQLGELGAPGLALSEMCNISLARDVWMHRWDMVEATGREPKIDPAVDAAVLVGVVAEWCELHGEPVDLELTGRLGGRFVNRTGGPRLRMDARDFCRVLAGRDPFGPVPDSRLLETRVPF